MKAMSWICLPTHTSVETYEGDNTQSSFLLFYILLLTSSLVQMHKQLRKIDSFCIVSFGCYKLQLGKLIWKEMATFDRPRAVDPLWPHYLLTAVSDSA